MIPISVLVLIIIFNLKEESAMRKVTVITLFFVLTIFLVSCSEEEKFPPEIIISAPEVARVNTPVTFDASASKDKDGLIDETTFSFDFGDGSEKVSGVSKASHTFTKAGDYKVTVKVSDNDKNESVKSLMISIRDNLPPVAAFAAPEKGRVNMEVRFDATMSSDPDGSIADYSFDFGDSSEKVSGKAIVYHKYTTAGVYDITLEVTDNEGAKSKVVHQIEVVDNLPPVAAFAAPSVSTEGEIVTVDAAQSYDPDGSILEYVFDFGDGSNTSKTVVSNHIYARAGEYTIKLTVKDNEGKESSVEKTITINSLASQSIPPKAIFSAPSTGIVNLPIIFDGSASEPGSGKITEYKWNFGDGSPEIKGMESLINHTYTAKGVYTVSLTITSILRDGVTTLSDSVSKQIAINEDGIAVTKIEPNTGTSLGGTEILITGANFPNDGSINVLFGTIAGIAINVLDSTRIKLITPPNNPGKVDVLVTSSKGSVLVNDGFTFFGFDNYATTEFCPKLLLSGGTSLGVKSTDDDVNYSIKLPFDFEFFGTKYTKDSALYISTNGWLSFTNTSALFNHSAIPSASNPATLIAPMFMDLKPGTDGQIYTEVSGSEPNRIFTIAFRKFTSNPAPNDEYNFEVSLYESSNDIKFQYLNRYNDTFTDGSLALVGIQDIRVGGIQASRNSSIRGLAPGGRVFVFQYNRPNYILQTDTTLNVYKHNPENNGNIGIQGSIVIDFTKELNSNSVTNNITMTDLTTNNSVPVNHTLSSDKRRVTITPENPLVVDRKYRINILTGLIGINNSTFSFDPTKVSCQQVSNPTIYTFEVTARAGLAQTFNLGNGSNPMQIRHLVNSGFAYIVKANGNRMESVNTNNMYSFSNIQLQDCNAPSYLVLNTTDTIGYVSCQNNRVAVVSIDPNNFYQIDTNQVTPGIQSINVGNQPAGIAIRNTNDRIYLANYNGGSVTVINTSTYGTVATINVGNNPVGVAINNQKNLLYVANRGDDSVSIIDIKSGSATENSVINTINLSNCNEPSQIAVTPDGSKYLVTCSGNNRVAIINANNNTQITNVNVGNNPVGIDITYDGKLAYVANFNGDSVTIINIESGTASQTVSTGGNTGPNYLTFIPNTYTALVTLYNTDQIGVIK